MFCNRFTLIVGIALAAVPVAAQTVLFVDDDAPAGGDGTSWTSAHRHLQNALTAAASIPGSTSIRVAEGVYKPDQGGSATIGDRTASFVMLNSVSLLGGYAGLSNPTAPDTRDVALHTTILSGDLAGDDAASFSGYDENSYHIVWSDGNDDTAVLEGFTLMSGNGNGDFPDDAGGAMYVQYGTPKVTQCVFTRNMAVYGGAVYMDSGSPILQECSFIDNGTVFSGGAMYAISESHPEMTDCCFIANRTGITGEGSSGGAMVNGYDSDPQLTECRFEDNSAVSGGAMLNYEGASPDLTQCTFERNSGGNGGAIYNYLNADSTLTDCMFYRNVATDNGTIVSWESIPALTNCRFIGNRATSGAGLYNYLNSNAVLKHCLFARNSATSSGGAIYNNQSAPSLFNCELAENQASYGAAIRNYDGSAATLASCTVSANVATYYGGGLNNSTSQPIVIDSILWANMDNGGANTDENAQVYGEVGSVTFSCIQDNDPDDSDIPFGGAANGNIDDDPLFLAGPNGAHYLGQTPGQTQDSPCVNTGSDTSEALDLDSFTTSRSEAADSGQVDMGCHHVVRGDPFICGDFDLDGDVDMADVAGFVCCLTTSCDAPPCRPSLYTRASCNVADFDDDGDVDLEDFNAVQGVLIGPTASSRGAEASKPATSSTDKPASRTGPSWPAPRKPAAVR